MCVVSNIGDDWRNRWPNNPINPLPDYDWEKYLPKEKEISRQEFDALKKEIEELKELLKAAKKYDDATGQPDCHMDDKVKLIKKIAEFVGVDLEDILK